MKILKKKKKKKFFFFFLRLGIFFSNWEKSHLNPIGKGAEFRPLRTQTRIARKPYIFVIFRGGGPDLDPHMQFHDILVLTTCDKDSDQPAQVCILNTALMAQVCQASLLLC